jgi:ABC-type multidrug transport system ATPase subunit
MSDAMIEIHGLRKRFGKHTVLDGVELTVPRGSIFGFLGLNGAGKTTSISVLLGLLKPDAGVCRVAGVDPVRESVEVRRRVGYMAENQTMYGWMRVREIIQWCGGFYPTWDATLADSLREQMSLSADAKVGTLSKGQSSKLALILALAHRPELVILDDPVLGLDPLARRDFLRDVIDQLQARDVTVFFSSHLLYEIEPICDRVAILHGGRIVACETVDVLRERVRRVELRSADASMLREVPSLLDVRTEGERTWLTVADFAAAQGPLEKMGLNGRTTTPLNLDEIFEAYVAGRREMAAI